MNKNLIWISLLITQCVYVISRPANDAPNIEDTSPKLQYNSPDEKVISVRITSSVAVGRGKGKILQKINEHDNSYNKSTTLVPTEVETQPHNADLPTNNSGANIEFIKQLNAKKEKEQNYQQQYLFQTTDKQHNENESDTRTLDESKKDELKRSNEMVYVSHNDTHLSNATNKLEEMDQNLQSSILDDALKISEERSNPHFNEQLAEDEDTLTTVPDESDETEEMNEFVSDSQINVRPRDNNDTEDSIAEPSIKSVLEIVNKDNENYENIENVPLARSVLQSPSSKNYIQGFTNKPPSEREPSARITTVSFNVVHDPPNLHNTYKEPAKSYINQHETYSEQRKFYEPQKVYSQPAQIYSEPAKFYSEPSKIYSEPAKIYSEPAKIYSEPAKIYSEPAKFYSEPASLHLNPDGSPNYSHWRKSPTSSSSTTMNTTPYTTIRTSDIMNTQPIPEHQAEKNYEVDEKVSVQTHGRSHGVQESTTEKCKEDNCKVGYVVKGREYNKYRVEERTSDGFIVGEYGVVRNEDGALRGVRYTADSAASPRLIYDALMKFLQLK